MKTIGDLVRFCEAHKDEIYVGWPVEQIGYDVLRHVRDGGCVISLAPDDSVQGLVFYKLNPALREVWISEAYIAAPCVFGKLLALGCHNERVPADGSWTLRACRRKYFGRSLRFPINQQTIRRLNTYGK